MSIAATPRMEFYFDNLLSPTSESVMQGDKPLLYKVIDEITYMGQTSADFVKAFRLAGPQRYRTLGCFAGDRPNATNVVLLISPGQTDGEMKEVVIQVRTV